MNRFELWDKVARCRWQQHFRLLVALWLNPNKMAEDPSLPANALNRLGQYASSAGNRA